MTRELTTGQRNRLSALAKAGQSLPWGRSDPALAKMRLVRKYGGPMGEEYADLTSDGLAMAQRIQKSAGKA